MPRLWMQSRSQWPDSSKMWTQYIYIYIYIMQSTPKLESQKEAYRPIQLCCVSAFKTFGGSALINGISCRVNSRWRLWMQAVRSRVTKIWEGNEFMESIVLFCKMSNRKKKKKIMWTLKIARCNIIIIALLRNSTYTSTALPQMGLPNFRAIGNVWTPILWFWYFTKSCGKSSYCFEKKSLEYCC